MGLNEVFKKVSAINEVTELASNKVELAGATVDTLQKKQIQAQKELESAKASTAKALAAINDTYKAYQQNGISCNEGLKMADEVIAIFKSIGVPPTGYILSTQKELQSTLKSTQAKLKALDAAKSQLSK